jgi:YidC/Oxa1 family membrane protein insertase
VLNPDSAQEELKELTTEETALPCEILDVIPDGKSEQIDLAPWKYSLFGEMGTYEVRLKIGDDGAVLTLPEGVERPDGLAGELRTRFTIHEAGAPTQMFRTFISKPLLNLLIFIASLMPGYNLGLAIIILTLIVKLVLFLPTQHAMEGQKKMQAVQPQLEAVKHKHKDDPKRMQAETMKLWKEHKVNPFQSCLPMLIQFPILIGLFFVIRDGSVLALSQHLLYSPYQDLSWDFGVQFLSLNLNEPNLYVLPPLLMISQFIQMKMSFAIAKRKKDEKGGGKKPASSQEMQQKMMLYGLPLMIGFFALKFPAAVALYWGVSTLFAIGQQLVVNRKTS